MAGLYVTERLVIPTGRKAKFLFQRHTPSFSQNILKKWSPKCRPSGKVNNEGCYGWPTKELPAFVQQPGDKKIIGTVGELQFEIQYHTSTEYGAKHNFYPHELLQGHVGSPPQTRKAAGIYA